MRTQLIIILLIIFAAIFSGCGGGTPPVNTPNRNANLSNSANATSENSNNPLETTKATPAQTINDAPTLKSAFNAYCNAKRKKDESALRKIYSADTIKNFEEQMKGENISSLLTFLETDVATKVCEIRNERIDGDSAIAEIKLDTYPNGLEVVFVKENGEWKMTNKSPTFQSIKPTNGTSNSAK